MKRIMMAVSVISTLTTLLFTSLYTITAIDAFETIAITLGITAYHFLMRLFVGFVINTIFKNNMDYRKKWFCQRKFEPALYKVLHVKNWKNHMPTYEGDFFDISNHSMTEIAGATCQAEIVHEIIVLLSFVPILTSVLFGAVWIMAITSLLSALFDMCFVIIQRYNRPRIVKMINRQK